MQAPTTTFTAEGRVKPLNPLHLLNLHARQGVNPRTRRAHPLPPLTRSPSPIDGEASFKESGSLPHGLHEGNERRQEHYYEDGGENAEDQGEDHFHRGLHGLGSGSLAP